MSNTPKGRKVRNCQLHSSNCFLPGVGQLEQSLPPSRKRIQGLEMYEQGDKLLIVTPFNGPGFPKHHFIPIANVQCGSYEDEEVVATSPVKPVHEKTSK